MDQHQHCRLDLIMSERTVRERMVIATESLEEIKAFKRLVEELRTPAGGDLVRHCPNLLSQVVDKAYAAERHVRLALMVGLDSLNELRDSGEWERAFGEIYEETCGDEIANERIREALYEAKDLLSNNDVDARFVDEVVEVVRQYKVGITAADQRLKCQFFEGEIERYCLLRWSPQPGDMARVSAAEFFAGGNTLFLGDLLFPPDCHHRSQPLDSRADELVELGNIYGAGVTTFAIARELAYRTARELDELGIPEFRGAAIGAAAAFFIFLAVLLGLLLTGAGIAGSICIANPNNQAACDARDWLLKIFAVLVGVGIFLFGASAAREPHLLGKVDDVTIVDVPVKPAI